MEEYDDDTEIEITDEVAIGSSEETRYWQVMRKRKQERHQSWHDANLAVLAASGLAYEMRPDSVLLREQGKPRVNFYLTTGRWHDIDNEQTHRGGAARFVEWYKRQPPPPVKKPPKRHKR